MQEHCRCSFLFGTAENFRKIIMIEKNHETRERVVCDYIAGMSDSYAIDTFEELFVPKAWKV